MPEAVVVRGGGGAGQVVQGARARWGVQRRAPEVRGRPRRALREAAELRPLAGPSGGPEAPPLVPRPRARGRGGRDEAAMRGRPRGTLREAALVRPGPRGEARVVPCPRPPGGDERRGPAVRAPGLREDPVLRVQGEAARVVPRARAAGRVQRALPQGQGVPSLRTAAGGERHPRETPDAPGIGSGAWRVPSPAHADAPGSRAGTEAGAGAGAGTGADGGPPGGAGGGARKKALRCNTCRVDFPGAAEHRAHFRSDLHRANLKRRAEGLEPLTEDLLAVPL